MGGRGGGGRSYGGGVRGGSYHRGGVPPDRTKQAAYASVMAHPKHPDFVATVYEKYPGLKEWYNSCSPKERWKIALSDALKSCPKVMDPAQKFGKYPMSITCHISMELLVDCPPEILAKHPQLPPISALGKSRLVFPLEFKDPLGACNMWKTILRRCLDENTNYDARWKCVPFQGFVQDHCPVDKRD